MIIYFVLTLLPSSHPIIFHVPLICNSVSEGAPLARRFLRVWTYWTSLRNFCLYVPFPLKIVTNSGRDVKLSYDISIETLRRSLDSVLPLLCDIPRAVSSRSTHYEWNWWHSLLSSEDNVLFHRRADDSCPLTVTHRILMMNFISKLHFNRTVITDVAVILYLAHFDPELWILKLLMSSVGPRSRRIIIKLSMSFLYAIVVL